MMLLPKKDPSNLLGSRCVYAARREARPPVQQTHREGEAPAEPLRSLRAWSHERRDGVALVIVLGLLAVMVLFAISFSISSRTERMATRSYADVVKARQLVHTAFNKVLAEQIPIDMADQSYPPTDVFALPDAGGVNLLGDESMTSAAVFVPMTLRPEAFAADPVEWIEMRAPDNTLLGEYAFLVVNCSGLLDANVIGARETDASPRLRGSDPGEIRFHPDILPEAFDAAAASLAAYRNNFARFESVPELYYLTSSTTFEGTMGTRPLRQIGGTSTTGFMCDNLHVFSRFPLGFANDDLSANTNFIVEIGGDPAGWDLTALADTINDIDGAPIPDVDAFIRVMQDYASENYVLAGANDAERFERISSKRVPMINEIIVSNSLQYIAASLTVVHTVYLTVETWYPFPEAGSEQFVVTYGSGPPVLNVMIQPPSPPILNALTGPYNLSGGMPAAFTPTPNSYAVHTFAFSRSMAVPGPPAASIRFRADVTLSEPFDVLYTGGAGSTVDRVNAGFAPRSLATPGVAIGGGVVAPVAALGASVNDPRINWSPTLHFNNTAPTPGAANSTIAGPTDEINFMYARQGPFESVGEIGYLLFDASKPWTTFRLFGGEPGYPVQASKLLDRLTVRSKTDYPLRGLVNPNTRQTDAMAAALWGLPLEQYPGGSSTALTADQARGVAGYFRTQLDALGSVTNVSDLVERTTAAGIDGQIGASDKFTRESVMRNSLGLLSTRHNLFTIFVAARTFADGYAATYKVTDSETVKMRYLASEQRAVAVVWRDPFSIVDGAGNETFQSWVQYFHWFSGAFGD